MRLNAPQWAESSPGNVVLPTQATSNETAGHVQVGDGRSTAAKPAAAKPVAAKPAAVSKYIFRPMVVRRSGIRPPPTVQRALVLALHCQAGTGATVYNGWIEGFKEAFLAGSSSLDLVDVVHLVPIELPGRGLRMKEPLLTRMDELVAEISSSLGGYMASEGLDDMEISETYIGIMGHSLGGWIGFEVTRRLAAGGLGGTVTPLCCIASGIRSPTLCGVENDIDSTAMHELDEEDFWRRMELRYGANRELEHPSVRRMMWPILKADFTVSETYRYDGGLLGLPLFIAGGSEDVRYDRSMLEAWGACQSCPSYPSSNMFRVEMFHGGHHYLFSKTGSMDAHVAWVMERLADSFALVGEGAGRGAQEAARVESPRALDAAQEGSDHEEGNLEDLRANRSDRASFVSEGVESSIFANPGTTQTLSDTLELMDGMGSVASMESMDHPAEGGDVRAQRKESSEPRCRMCSIM